jgi:hypothetical protein
MLTLPKLRTTVGMEELSLASGGSAALPED